MGGIFYFLCQSVLKFMAVFVLFLLAETPAMFQTARRGCSSLYRSTTPVLHDYLLATSLFQRRLASGMKDSLEADLCAYWTHLYPANPPSPRRGHQCSVVNNNLYVFGGQEDARESASKTAQPSFYMLECLLGPINRGQKQWVKVDESLATGPAPCARYGHGQAVIGHDIYVFGGHSASEIASKNDLYAFDTTKNQWRCLSHVPEDQRPSPRAFHGMCSVGTDLFVFGGYDCRSKKTRSDLWKFDSLTETWTELPALDLGAGPSRSGRMGSCLLGSDKKLFVFGGQTDTMMVNDTAEFNFETQKWSRVFQKGNERWTPRSAFAGCTLKNNDDMIIFGGQFHDKDERFPDFAGVHFTNALLLFDPKNCNEVRELRPCKNYSSYFYIEKPPVLPPPQGFSSMAPLGPRHAVLFGGTSFSTENGKPETLNDLWILALECR
eukprot:g46859.t1